MLRRRQRLVRSIDGPVIMRLQAKRAVGRLTGLLPTRSGPRRLILLYHSVGDGPLATSEEQFRQQIGWLLKHASVTDLDGLVAGRGLSDIQVAITFDDGYSSLRRVVLPIVESAGLRATVFLNTAWVGDGVRKASEPNLGHYPGETFLLWKEVEELCSSGWEVGSHGVEHLDLTKVDAAIRTRELRASRQHIEERLGRLCKYFAYTWGRNNFILRHSAASAGYKAAFSGIHRAVSADVDMFAIPRVNIDRTYNLEDFAAIVWGRWDFIGAIQKTRSLFS